MTAHSHHVRPDAARAVVSDDDAKGIRLTVYSGAAASVAQLSPMTALMLAEQLIAAARRKLS